jgi:hypothetical protein
MGFFAGTMVTRGRPKHITIIGLGGSRLPPNIGVFGSSCLWAALYSGRLYIMLGFIGTAEGVSVPKEGVAGDPKLEYDEVLAAPLLTT